MAVRKPEICKSFYFFYSDYSVINILYFGAIFFLKKYDINGIVINQLLLYIVITSINLYCYYRFILNMKKVKTENDR